MDFSTSLRQERFASSPEFRGDFLLGNLVAKRAALLDDPERRKLIWAIQDFSTRQGKERHPTCDQFAAWPLGPSPGKEGGLDQLAWEVATRAAGSNTEARARSIKHWIGRLAIDPDASAFGEPERFTGIGNALEILSSIFKEVSASPLARVADTAIKRTAWDALDYCLQCRGMVLITGTYRVGKSFSAQAWAQRHIGEARYVQLTSAPTDEAFFRQIAQAIGVASSLKLKGSEIRARVEATLHERQLALIIDEAQYVLPQTVRTKQLPQRLCWILTSLCNRGVPVALIASRDFTRIMNHLKRTLSIFGWEQFDGRLRRHAELPDYLEEQDLVEIARILAPEADKPSLLLLAGLALRASGHVATIESVVSRARFLARRESRRMDFRLFEHAAADLDPTFRPSPSAPTIRATPAASAQIRRGAPAAAAARQTFEPNRQIQPRKAVLFTP